MISDRVKIVTFFFVNSYTLYVHVVLNYTVAWTQSQNTKTKSITIEHILYT